PSQNVILSGAKNLRSHLDRSTNENEPETLREACPEQSRRAQRDSAIFEMSSRIRVSRTCELRSGVKKNRAGIFHGAISFENYRCKSGFCFLCLFSGLLTLRFQLSELLCRKNSFRLF